jgi:catechol 2,3-dioxygenase-like lactoylglutathione lyase family enzyme
VLKNVFDTSVLVTDQDRALDFYTNVLGLEKPADGRAAGGTGAQDQRAMGNRLIARRTDPSAQGSAPPGAEGGGLARGGHGVDWLRGG